MGALAYADDIALLAPTTRAMRLMFGICDDFAQEYVIDFYRFKLQVSLGETQFC